MRGLLVAGTGLSAVLLHPLRSLVTVACLVAVLLPYLVGLGISRGVQKDAEDAVRFGADLYVTGSQFGRDVPVSVSAADTIRQIDGRLRELTKDQLTKVRDYEQRNKARKGVLRSIDRKLA